MSDAAGKVPARPGNRVGRPENLKKGGGRKGIPNKTTRSFREAVEMAADKLGGSDRLVAWCREDTQNERLFWSSIYPRLAPLQVTGADGGPLKVVVEELT